MVSVPAIPSPFVPHASGRRRESAVTGVVAFVALFVAACSHAPEAPASKGGGTTAVPAASAGEPPTTESTPDAGETGPPVIAPLPASWGPSACPSGGPPTGFAVGETLGDLGIVDCDTGTSVSTNELCGASATWVFVAHTHCPTCQATAGFTDDVAMAVASKNVAIAHIVHDDNGTSCAKWREAYKLAGFSNVRVYEDPTGGAYAKLRKSNYTAPSAFLDANRVITFKEHGLPKSKVLAEIDAALAHGR